MILTDFGAGTREIFTLRAARAVSASYGDERLARIRAEKSIARERLSASRRVADPHAAIDNLEVALEHAMRAAHIASGDVGEFVSPAHADHPESFAHAEAWRDELDARVAKILSSVESRNATELLGLRIGRFAAIAIVLLLATRAIVRHYGVHNVALGKPVTASSLGQGKPGTGLVDGRTRDTFAIHTNAGAHPFVMIDLGRTYRIRSIRVFNRGDGWFDEVLPLTLELSIDGTTFHEMAQRTTHFDVWQIDLGDADARYVRATKENGYIALNEIEVYSRE